MQNNYQTLEKLVKRCIERLSMYTGTSVQIYAEDRISQMILDNYNLVINSFPWQTSSFWKKYTLSGLNGEVIEDVSKDITLFDDILAIFPDENMTNQLRNLHLSTPPSLLAGNYPVYFRENIENPEKIFQVIPYEAKGDIFVNIKCNLNTYGVVNPRTIIPFDSDYLVYAVCFDYLCDDDSSQTQAQKFMSLRDERLRQLKVQDNSKVIDYNNNVAYNTINDWR